MVLTERDLSILHALCRAVRLFAWDQLRNWWPTRGGKRPALRRLALLVRFGLLKKFRIHARPPVVLHHPVIAWEPGQDDPNFHMAAAELRARWNRVPKSFTVYVASKRCANLLGGVSRGRVRTPLQASHDLGVAAVYLHYLSKRPDEARSWRGEDLNGRAHHGVKKPDAMVLNVEDGIRKAIEFGAGYPPARLQAFHRHCERHHLPYEVW